MNAKELKPLIGHTVFIHKNGLIITGKLVSIAPQFNERDVFIQLPGQKKPRRFWAKNVTEKP